MRNLLKRAAQLRGVVPSSFYLQNINRIGLYPFAHGGFSDVYKGELDGSLVVLKVLRFFQALDDPDRKRKVCAKSVNNNHSNANFKIQDAL